MSWLSDPFLDPIVAQISFGAAVLLLWLSALRLKHIGASTASLVSAMQTLMAGYFDPSIPRYLLWIVGTLAVVTFALSLYCWLGRRER